MNFILNNYNFEYFIIKYISYKIYKWVAELPMM